MSNIAYYEIPLSPAPQTFAINLAGNSYQFSLAYREAGDSSWILDIADSVGNSLYAGIPLVTGTDLLVQHPYLNFGGALVVYSDSDLTLPPTFDNLGITSHLLFITGIPAIQLEQPEAPAIALPNAQQPPPVQFVLPNAPSSVATGSYTDFTILVTWSPSTIGTPPLSYEVQYSTDDAVWVTFGLPVTNPFVTVTGLTQNTQYYFRVAALNAAGTGPFSAPVTGTTISGSILPGAPTNVNVAGAQLPGAPTNLILS